MPRSAAPIQTLNPSQEAEEQLEEVRARSRSARARADAAAGALQAEIGRLRGRVAAAAARSLKLQACVQQVGAGFRG